MGLSYSRGKRGAELFLHNVSNRTFTTKETLVDSSGKTYYLDVRNRYRQFSYSLEYTWDASSPKWSKLKTILAGGIRHDMYFNRGDNFPMEGELTTRSHQIALYVAPKVQYRISNHFFMEAALPCTFFSHHYIKSRYVEKSNPEIYRAGARGDGEMRLSMMTLRLGVGYSF
jgi:hypothetical protein